MLKWLGIIIAAVALISGVSAQENVPRLRVPTAEEYLSLAAEIGAPVWVGLIIAEAETRYGEELSQARFETLAQIIDRLPIVYEGDPELWENARLMAWLRENPVDFTGLVRLKAHDYDLQIAPADLDSDGDDEFVVEVKRDCSKSEWCNSYSLPFHAVLALDRQPDGGYRLLPSDLPSTVDTPTYRSQRNIYPLGVQDVTGDGIPEITVAVSFYGGFDYTRYKLYVMGLKDGRLVDLSAEPIIGIRLNEPLPPNIWRFEVDSAGIGIINQHVTAYDNWHCQREDINRFRWNGESFVFDSTERIYVDDFACEARFAEEAMLIGDFDAAVTHYEAAFQHEPELYGEYTAVRRALAYALAGDMDSAGSLLNDLYTNIDWKQDIPARLPNWITSVWEAYQENPDAIHVCLQAYRFILESPFYFYLPNAIVGVVEDEPEYYYLTQYAPRPEASACNPDFLLDDMLAVNAFTVQSTPVDQITGLGWPVRTSFHADLNGDHIEDWLVWVDAEQLEPILFVSNDDHFSASRFTDSAKRYSSQPYFPAPNYTFAARKLPGDAGYALVVLDGVRLSPYVTQITGMGVTPYDCPGTGEAGSELRIWKINRDTVDLIGNTVTCGYSSADEIELGIRLNGWTKPADTMVPETLVWDDLNQNYQVVPSSSPTPEHNLPDQPGLRPVLDTYSGHRYENLLSITESTVRINYDEDSPDDMILTAYLRALALEGLGRDDEAAAQFAIIAADNSQPQWAALAALHLEPSGQ